MFNHLDLLNYYHLTFQKPHQQLEGYWPSKKLRLILYVMVHFFEPPGFFYLHHSHTKIYWLSHTKVTSLLQPCCKVPQGCKNHGIEIATTLLQGCGEVATRLWRHCTGENERATHLRGDSNLHTLISYLTITSPLPLEPICLLTNLCCCSCIYSCNGILYQPSLV